MTFPHLGLTYTLVTLIHDRPDQPELTRQFSLLVDPASGEVREDINALRAAEEEAYRAKYGKLHPELYELLQSASDDTLFPIAVWAAPFPGQRSLRELEEEAARLHPDAVKALQERGVAWAVDDPDLRIQIEQKYNQLLAEETHKQVQPVIEWLQARGYAVQELPGVPTVAATLTKQDILALAQRPDVSEIFFVGHQEVPASDSPTQLHLPQIWLSPP
jgi:hypothetical protein